MQLIITSFESVTGLGAAAPYTMLARRSISRQFRGLRDAIGDRIQQVCKALGEELASVPVLNKGETPRLRILDQRLRHHRVLQQQLQQRGLPDRSVSVLRAWLFEHFLHPYPKVSEKLMLARLTGLTRNQVSNWFVNARVRLWKPMIEGIYVRESKVLESNVGATIAPTFTTSHTDGKLTNAVSYNALGDEFKYFIGTSALGSRCVEHVDGAYSEIIPTVTQMPQEQHSNMAPMQVDEIALLTQYL